MKKSLLFVILLSFLYSKDFAQTTDTTKQAVVFAPIIDGSLKTKVEFDTEHGKMRFEVRNARFGFKGNVNKYFGYRAEIDLSDEGKIRMLDAFVKVSPFENLDVFMGQRKVPFGTDYIRSPVENIFANRSFIAKYVNDGLRDIGFTVNYRIKTRIPIDLWVAAMNGTGLNNPQWIDQPNYSARLLVGPFKNIRIAGNYYHGATLLEKKLTMIGGELRFQNKKFLIETEYMQRQFTDTSGTNKLQDGFYIHSYYNFFTKCKMIKIISPVLRWDLMGNHIFENDKMAERITGGVNFGFDLKQFTAEIRFNYEKYLKSYYSTHFDKFVIEFIAKF
jgi:hypothetical protein